VLHIQQLFLFLSSKILIKMMSATVLAAPEALNGHKMTPEAYLARERAGIREFEGKYELFNQTLLFMAGASEAHNDIAGNISAIFKQYIWQNELQSHVFQSDMKVVSFLDYKDYFYPDVVFIKGKTIYDDYRKDVLINPTVIFEVLSDGTKDFDRTDKFESYKKINSLQEYVLVSQYERKIEHFYKNLEGDWDNKKTIKTGELTLVSIPFSLLLKQIYHGMSF
jgi:Uma2 family endonuclease